MKIGDLVLQRGAYRSVGLVVDLDFCNDDALVLWGTKLTWSEIKYLEVVS